MHISGLNIEIQESLISDNSLILIIFFGGNSKEETPVPIPNTEVKLFSADGTAWAAVRESRTLPRNLYITARIHFIMSPGFLYLGKSQLEFDVFQIPFTKGGVEVFIAVCKLCWRGDILRHKLRF